MIKTLVPYMKKYSTAAILAPITVILEVLLEIRIPLLMARIVDVGIPNRDIGYVLRTGGMMVAMALLSLFFGVVCARLTAKAGAGFGSEIRRGLFEKVQNFSFSNVDKFSTASLITRTTSDVNNLQMAYMMVIRMLARAPVMLVGATFMAFTISSSLVRVFLVAIPVLAIALGVIASKAYPRFRQMLTRYDGVNASVQENLIAIRVVKAFVRENHEKKKFQNANDELRDYSIRAEKILVWNGPIMQITMYSCIVCILWFGGNMIVGGSLQTGDLISFISYVSQILMSLMLITNVFVMLVMSRASGTRIIEVLQEEPDIENPENAGDVKVKDGSIEFRDVVFGYNKTAERPVLDHVNLKIPNGLTVGIIGGTGSAKSSLVQLIPRLYDVTEGQVLVGGRDVREYDLKELRNSVAMVLQKNVLFSGTIRDNLRWGNEEATDEEIVEACKAAQAHDFITSFPDGYDTDLGQGGVNVSGGQKQRLCIARALLKHPKILIMDDSTSAVDTATDAKIRAALAAKQSGTTTLIIAQRITSVCDADLIVVLDDGHVNGVGTHEELLANNEIYREVYHSQQKGVA